MEKRKCKSRDLEDARARQDYGLHGASAYNREGEILSQEHPVRMFFTHAAILIPWAVMVTVTIAAIIKGVLQ